VNRSMGPIRFTITMLENRTNAEGKFLPVSYVVNTWDNKTGALQRSEAHFQSWQRVGAFDLPATTRVVTATAEARGSNSPPTAKDGLDTRSLTLSQHKLNGSGR